MVGKLNVGVGVMVGVRDCVGVGVRVGVQVAVEVSVAEDVRVDVEVSVCVAVGTRVWMEVAVGVSVAIRVGEMPEELQADSSMPRMKNGYHFTETRCMEAVPSSS
jgi:hypothetical protein